MKRKIGSCRKMIRLLLMLMSVFSALAMAGQQAKKPIYVVIMPVTNMFQEPDANSDVVSQAIFASNVEVLEIRTVWAHIQTADEYTGWVRLAELHKTNGGRYAESGAVVRVAQLSANLYREPDVTLHAPLITVPWETRLEVIADHLDENNHWLKVRLPDGAGAYVQRGDISDDFTSLTIDQMISTARKFLGVTYTWGGTSSFGFDCSGFMQMLERQRGILMPRDADQQAAWNGVMAVERKNLLPGDLLYFGDSPSQVEHTGMYIGNGEFIHDTTNTHPMVQISKLDDQPWTKLLVAARRVRQ